MRHDDGGRRYGHHDTAYTDSGYGDGSTSAVALLGGLSPNSYYYDGTQYTVNILNHTDHSALGNWYTFGTTPRSRSAFDTHDTMALRIGGTTRLSFKGKYEIDAFVWDTLDAGWADGDEVVVKIEDGNTAPAARDGDVSTHYDSDYVFAPADFGFSDPNSCDWLNSVRIATVPAAGKGTLTLGGTTVAAGDVVPAADIEAGNLKYSPRNPIARENLCEKMRGTAWLRIASSSEESTFSSFWSCHALNHAGR